MAAKTSYSDIMVDGSKLFSAPKNAMEKDIADYILTRTDSELEGRIHEKKLTLTGCLEHCFDKGHRLEVKSGSRGIARVSEEQHFKWVCEYFGIKYVKLGNGVQGGDNPPVRESKPDALSLDSLLDF